MKKKPTKIEEPAAPYLTNPPTKPNEPPAIRYADTQSVRNSNAKLMEVHRKVLQKLAQ